MVRSEALSRTRSFDVIASRLSHLAEKCLTTSGEVRREVTWVLEKIAQVLEQSGGFTQFNGRNQILPIICDKVYAR
jgi:hypothetical protein